MATLMGVPKNDVVHKPLIYLASPHKSDDNYQRDRQIDLTKTAVAEFLNSGYNVYSPVLYRNTMPRVIETWQGFERAMIDKCDEFWLLIVRGVESNRSEYAYAELVGKPIRQLTRSGGKFQLSDLIGKASVKHL